MYNILTARAKYGNVFTDTVNFKEKNIDIRSSVLDHP